MDFLNKAATQLNDLFRSMTPAARITSGLLLAVVVSSLAFLFRFQSSALDDYLLGGHVFQASDMNAALGALATAGLVNFQPEGNRIKVPRSRQDVYIAALVDASAMPRHIGSWWEEYDKNTSPFEAQGQRELRFKLATQRELAQVVAALKDIDHAMVTFDETKPGGLRGKMEVTASVAVMPSGNQDLEPERVKTIRAFVAGAIAGLQPRNVTVIDLNSGYSYAGIADGDTPGAENDHYASRKRMYEREWRNKISTLLGYIPGVKVVTNVQLDTELQRHLSSVKYDPQPVATRTEFSTRTETIIGQGPGGRPGVVPNTSNQQATVTQQRGPESDKSSEREVSESVPSHQQIVSQKAPLTPQRVTVSIAVPRSYYKSAWESRNRTADGQPPAPPDEATLQRFETTINQEIQNAIINLLPPNPPGDDKYPLVNVGSFDDQTIPPLPQPGTVEKVTSWLAENWTTLGMMGIALAGLLMLRTMVRAAPNQTDPVVDLAETLSVIHADDEDEVEEEESGTVVKRRRRFSESGPNPREELTEMVNENPEAAAAILRSWIGEAS